MSTWIERNLPPVWRKSSACLACPGAERDAELSGANLQGTILDRTIFRGANLWDVVLERSRMEDEPDRRTTIPALASLDTFVHDALEQLPDGWDEVRETLRATWNNAMDLAVEATVRGSEPNRLFVGRMLEALLLQDGPSKMCAERNMYVQV